MRTKNFFKHLIFGALFLATGEMTAQVTTANNVAGAVTDFLGWDNTFPTNNFPLMVRHDLNQPIEWSTDAIRRMLLTPTVTGATENTYTGLDLSGFLGVGQFNPGGAAAIDRPFAMIHIDDGGWNSAGYRPWMRQGTMVTHESDFSYFGMKDEGNAENHTVIAWSDNDIWDPGPDHMKFIFTSYLNQNGAAGNLNGLEAGRFTPDASGDLVYFGLGDWFNSGGQLPNERLDLLDRTIRLRDFSTSATTSYLNQAASVDRVLVADENDGTVYWRPMSDFAGQTDCDWDEDASNQRLTTAWSGAGSCNSEDWQVGIGEDAPGNGTKLDVLQHDMYINNRAIMAKTVGGSSRNYGIQAQCYGSLASENYGITAYVEDGTTRNYGFQTQAFIKNGVSAANNRGVNALAQVSGSGSSATDNYGVFSWAYVTGATVGNNYGGYFRSSKNTAGTITGNSYGVYGTAAGATGIIPATGTPAANFGVYGLATSATPGDNIGVYGRAALGATNNWGGYFVGAGFLSAAAWTYSDAALKLNVNDVTSATAKLMQLEPKTYEMDRASYPDLGLSDRPQIGLIAQDLEAVFPELVRDVRPPAILDSLGNLVSSSTSYKAVNYDGLIPVLIAAIKEQQAQMDQMQAQLDGCCTSGGLDHRNEESGSTGGVNSASAVATDLTISPNPFSTNTTLRFNLSEEEDARVVATDQRGKEIATLFQARTSGPQQVEWDTNMLPDGMYYVSLYVDDELIVKKAVKMAR